jgi:signal transduction histidine kinase
MLEVRSLIVRRRVTYNRPASHNKLSRTHATANRRNFIVTTSFSGTVETGAAPRPGSPVAGSDGLLVLDAAQRCLSANEVIAHLFDTNIAAFTHQPLASLPLPKPLIAVLAETADAALAGNGVRRAHVAMEGEQGASHAYSILALPGGDIVTLILTPANGQEPEVQHDGGPSQSRAALRIAHLRAEAALFMRDHVLGVVSHDLRGPLNAIHSWGYVLERKVDAADAAAIRALGGIRSGVEQQVKLIEQFIDTTRAETKTLTLNREHAALRTLIDSSIADANASLAASRDVTLSVASSLAEEQINADRERATQALWLMIVFASEMSAAGSTVSIKSAVDGGLFDTTVSFDVSVKSLLDPTLPHVLETFARSQATQPREAGRIAWGLALCKRVAEAHGGSFDQTDIVDNAPATLTLKLPTASA